MTGTFRHEFPVGTPATPGSRRESRLAAELAPHRPPPPASASLASVSGDTGSVSKLTALYGLGQVPHW